MSRRVWGTTLVVVLTQVAALQLLAQDTDPILGTWDLNIAKSKFVPGPPPASSWRTYTTSTDQKNILAAYEIVLPTGETLTRSWTATYDGVERTSGDRPGHSSRLTYVDRYTGRYEERLHGRVTVRGTRRISRDGKTMTITAKGVNERGEKVDSVWLYDKRPSPPAAGFRISPVDEARRAAARDGMVTSANPLASDAGVAMLRAGGNAVDAAVAAAFALGVVEPQMSGLGGSGAATVWLAAEGRPVYLDFYAAQFVESWRGSPALKPARGAGESTMPDLRSVGIPGEVAGLLALHQAHGTLTRQQILAPAIALAEDGFPVGKILADFIAAGETKMKPYAAAMDLYFPGGKPAAPGAILRNPLLAESLRRIARDGARGFYEGPIAAAMRAVMNGGGHPATARDFVEYAPQWKPPLCTDYRGHTILSAPPPQTGMRVLHTLELLEGFDLAAAGLPTRSAAAFDILTSALRVGQAGVSGNGDPNWTAVPAGAIASDAFAATRRPLVGTGKAPAAVARAQPEASDPAPLPPSCAALLPRSTTTPAMDMPAPAVESPGDDHDPSGDTTHVSVVDRAGNAVALTVTNSTVWGSGAFAAGFFLNDSGFRFTEQNVDAPSRSRWRIRTTTIAPTVVLKDRAVRMVIGAPGAGRIPTEIVQVMVYTLDYDLDPLDAVRMPRIFASAATPQVQVEHGFTPELLRAVRAMGYDPIAESSGYARLYLVVRRGDHWIGVADPRHDGQPRGYEAGR